MPEPGCSAPAASIEAACEVFSEMRHQLKMFKERLWLAGFVGRVCPQFALFDAVALHLFQNRSIYVSTSVDAGSRSGLIQKLVRGCGQAKGENFFLNFELRRLFRRFLWHE
jgi:hypothetical protein